MPAGISESFNTGSSSQPVSGEKKPLSAIEKENAKTLIELIKRGGTTVDQILKFTYSKSISPDPKHVKYGAIIQDEEVIASFEGIGKSLQYFVDHKDNPSIRSIKMIELKQMKELENGLNSLETQSQDLARKNHRPVPETLNVGTQLIDFVREKGVDELLSKVKMLPNMEKLSPIFKSVVDVSSLYSALGKYTAFSVDRGTETIIKELCQLSRYIQRPSLAIPVFNDKVAIKLLIEKGWLQKIEDNPSSIGASRGSNAPAKNLLAYLRAVAEGRRTAEVYMTFVQSGGNHYKEATLQECLQSLNEVPKYGHLSAEGTIFRGFSLEAYNALAKDISELSR